MLYRLQKKSIKEGDDQVAHTDAHEGGDEACQLEAMVDDKTTNARSSRTVEIDSCDFGWIVGNEEIAVHSREHSYQCQWRDAQTNAQRIECSYGCCLREEHDRHEEQCYGKEEWILGDNLCNMRFEEFEIAIEERVAHPCNTKNTHHGIHSSTKDIAFDGILYLSFTYKQDDS